MKACRIFFETHHLPTPGKTVTSLRTMYLLEESESSTRNAGKLKNITSDSSSYEFGNNLRGQVLLFLDVFLHFQIDFLYLTRNRVKISSFLGFGQTRGQFSQ